MQSKSIHITANSSKWLHTITEPQIQRTRERKHCIHQPRTKSSNENKNIITIQYSRARLFALRLQLCWKVYKINGGLVHTVCALPIFRVYTHPVFPFSTWKMWADQKCSTHAKKKQSHTRAFSTENHAKNENPLVRQRDWNWPKERPTARRHIQ